MLKKRGGSTDNKLIFLLSCFVFLRFFFFFWCFAWDFLFGFFGGFCFFFNSDTEPTCLQLLKRSYIDANHMNSLENFYSESIF